MAVTVVARPDLSARTALSKSALVAFDLCQTKSYLEMTARRPMLPSEKVSFGSALDAACETLVIAKRDGWPEARALQLAIEAVDYVSERDAIELPADELSRSVRGFWNDVAPRFDWTEAETQPEINVEIPGLGPVSCHPDVVLRNVPIDVKSSRYKKDLPSVELGLYAIAVEERSGSPVTEAYYLTWVRSGKGRWEIQHMPITGETRRWTWENARRYAGARDLALGMGEAGKAVFAGGPKFAGLCRDCQYAPANGGPCAIAWNGEDTDA